MKFLRAVVGYAIAGMIVMTVWGAFAGVEGFGIIGGWLAAFAIIGPMWYMNHFLGLIHHDADSGWVDMGLGIGLVGLFRDTFGMGFDYFLAAMPTLLLVAVGAVIGGFVAAKIEENMEKGGN